MFKRAINECKAFVRAERNESQYISEKPTSVYTDPKMGEMGRIV